MRWRRLSRGSDLARAIRNDQMRRRARRLRVATWALLGLGGFGATGGAVATGWGIYDRVSDPDRSVTATTSAESTMRPVEGYGVAPRWLSPVSWTDRSGGVHRGEIAVSMRLAAGVPVAAGLTASGTLRHEPPPAADAWVRALLAAGAVEGIAVLLLWQGRSVGRRRVEAVRLRSWDRSWAEWATRPEHLGGN
jgi:hypothetical protein